MKNVRIIGFEVGVGYLYLGAFDIEYEDFQASLLKFDKWDGGYDFDILFVFGIMKYLKYVH